MILEPTLAPKSQTRWKSHVGISSHWPTMWAVFMTSLLVASPTAFGQSKVLDSWVQSHNIEATTDSQIGDPQVAGSIARDVGNTDSFIIGDWRNVYVQADNVGVTKSVSNSGVRSASTDNGTNANGTVRIFWDGTQAFAGGATPVTADPLRFSALGTLDAGSEISFDLGENFFEINCTGSNNTTLDSDLEFSLLFGETDQQTVDIEVHVFTDATHWSKAEATQTDGDARVFSFNLSSDFTAETGSAGPADFSDVGAIVLSTSTTAPAVDVGYSSPAVVGCGTDFADAPIRHDQVDLARVSYRTEAEERARQSFFDDGVEILTATNVFDPETRTFRGPHHTIGGPFIGLSSDTAEVDSDEDGQPTPGADGDDGDGNDDEAGVTLTNLGISDANNQDFQSCDGIAMNPAEGRENWYCAEVQVSNPTSDWAQVVGWIDFQGNGAFDNLCGTDGGIGSGSSGVVEYGGDVDNPDSDFCERSSSTLVVGATGLSNAAGSTCSDTSSSGDTLDQNGDFTGGNVPPGCEGTLVMTWDLSNVLDDLTLDETFARFRISTDAFQRSDGSGFYSALGPSPFAYASDGEVEDYRIGADSLPVSIHSFDSRFTENGLVIEWGTVSETRNAGFHIWVDRGDGMELLGNDMIPSKAIDPLQPQRYRHVFPKLNPGDVKDLAITAVDYSGTEEMYGLFEAGAKYGETVQPAPIAWDRIDQDVKSRMQAHAAFAKMDAGAALHSKASTRNPSSSLADMRADIQVRAAGLHRVTWQDLADAGLDLSGVESNDIAVTLNGKPVSRHVVSPAANETRAPKHLTAMRGAREAGGTPEFFGPGAEILFWAEKPGLPDKLYVDDYIYRISVNSSSVLNAGARSGRGKPGPRSFMARIRRDEDISYQFASPFDDPWVAAVLRADRTNSYSASFEVDDALVSSDPGHLTVNVAGLTDFDVNPDHRIQVEVNGTVVTDVVFDGRAAQSLKMVVPAGVLVPGVNTVRVVAPGGTAAPVDLSLVDTVELEYPRFLQAVGDRILVENLPDSGGLTVSGLTTTDTVAYAWDGAELIELNRHQFSRGSVRVPTAGKGSDYWISAVGAVLRPETIEVSASRDLLAGRSADFLVVGHPAFLPLSANESHPLNDYVTTRESEGWNVGIFDIQDIQREYSNGMPLPGALTKFLNAADQRLAYDHVLLVGGDSYDYTDNLGLGSVSFIPTVYASTSNVPHTPSDSLLADLDGDGVSDKALGRWPVRSMSDLQSIVTKTLDWSGDSEALSNAVWVTDSQDPSQPSFRAQVGRMVEPLHFKGWIDAEIAAIYFDDVTPSGGMSVADAARASFFDRLEQGRSVSGFVGHGAPAMWTFQGLLTPDDITELYNEGNPTLIGTLTCYTTYFVSPYSDTVAHRWMNGYREDAAGNAIPGVPNGAVAIHGAATLSDYGQNERIAKSVLERQLSGETLGSAIRQVRSEAAGGGLQDQVINWTLLGDPTLMLD